MYLRLFRLTYLVLIFLFAALGCSGPGHLNPGTAFAKGSTAAPGGAPASARSGKHPGFPVDFSARVVEYDPPYPRRLRGGETIYVSKGRMLKQESGEDATNLLIDATTGHEWLLLGGREWEITSAASMDQQRHSFGVSASSRPILEPVDLTQPCANFQDVTCQSLGTETVNGRATQKWEFTQMFGDHSSKSYQWIDLRLLVPIKIEDRRSGKQFLDIKEGPQPEALFPKPSALPDH